MQIFFYQQLFPTITSFLKQGLSPLKLALGFSLGTVIGVIPLLFVATPLCAVSAYFLGVNQAIIQIANHSIGYPLQILLFYPFTLVGSLFVFKSCRLSSEVAILLWTSSYIAELGIFIMQALIGWIVSAPLIFLIFFMPLYFVLQRVKI